MGIHRNTAEDPCPICGGHEKLPQGQGIRCFGFVGDDGWAVCTREGEGTRAKYHSEAQGWGHALKGPCPCGTVHQDDPEWEARIADKRASEKRAKESGGSVHSIGESKRAKIVDTYRYESRKGALLYEVCRMEPKSFRQRRPHPTREGEWIWSMKAGKDPDAKWPDHPTVLYKIPDIAAALLAGDRIWICEGEKDVHTLNQHLQVATCNTGGAGKWRPELSKPFSAAIPGSDIVIIQDRDEPGERHARQVYDEIAAVIQKGVHLRIVEPIEGKDATDHLGIGHGIEEFALVWPVSDEMLKTAPAIFKRNVLRQAILMPESALQEAVEGEVAESPPPFKSPLRGDQKLAHLQGVVTLAGGPSAGKSYFAIGCGIDNALDADNPWDVFYLNCEMGSDYVIDRSLRAASSISLSMYECRDARAREHAAEWAKDTAMPQRFVRVDVGIGVTIQEVIDFLADNVTDTPTLVILDSISSFVDNMDEIEGDNFGMSNLRTVQKYATAVRRLTKGHVSWLILSELNKEGRAKGRSLDHRSDMAIAMTKDPDRTWLKHLTIGKSWFSEDGPVGTFVLFPDIARLVRNEGDQ